MSYQPMPPGTAGQAGTTFQNGNNGQSGLLGAPSARLFMLSGDQGGREYRLVKLETSLGRGANNDIVIADPKTSRRHMQIVAENGRWVALDAGSANGFYINELQTQRAELHDGDIITIGLVRMAFHLDSVSTGPGRTQSPATLDGRPTQMLDPNAPPLVSTMAAGVAPPPQTIDETGLEHVDLRSRPVTSLGREQKDNTTVLDNPQISRRHAQLANQNGVFVITDQHSTNGTFVNGQRINVPTTLADGDIINLGPYRFMFTHGFLHRSQEEDSVRVDVLNLAKQVTPQLNLLHNVTFTILPREFVAIVGVSGSGKSTLMDAISGVRPATAGTVLYNKAEYYPQMEVYRSAIGYVPQDDIVPSELTVYKALYYAARLRLPQDTSDAEIKERLEDVIDDLDLEQRRDTPIHLLSGGQRKRVSIGAELISKPSLFFLDEPTSGLDPGLEGRMMQLMRKLADQGRTVVLITHATQNVELCDQVLFLARGGYVAFYGSPQDALKYFEVQKFSEIYLRLEQELTPEEWARRFFVSPYYNRNVGSRVRAVAVEAQHYGVPVSSDGQSGPPLIPASSPAPSVVFRRAQPSLSGIQQFFLLARRYTEIITRDTKNLLILLVQAPILAIMMTLVFNRTDWNKPGGDYSSAKTLVFLMVIVAIWLGTSNAAREIVKEAAIYRRERRIGLKLVPYIFSKLVVQTVIVIIQIAFLVGIVWVGTGLGSPSLESIGYFYLTLILTALAGVTLGLLISAMTSNSDRATSFVPIILIPQIIFSGAVVALDHIGVIGDWFSNLMGSKWGYQTAGAILNLDSVPSPRIKFNGPPPEQAGRIEALFNGSLTFDTKTYSWYLIPSRDHEFNINVLLEWGYLGIMIVVALALIVFFQLRKDRQYNR